ACDSAVERGVPLIAVTSSGGARMQEGILSLMQLPKTVCAVEDLHDAGQAMIVVMAHPTTAGVLASFASLGDVLLAEPGALIAFTGPRVVEQTTREKLPDDFGLAEQNLRFGHLDAILERRQIRPTLRRLLRALDGDGGRGDDGAMVTGLGKLDGRTIALIAQQKGRDIQERTRRQFGMPYPEGYRKAIRVFELADRLGFPVVSLVDTPGAYPGV